MATVQRFEDLGVWQDARELVRQIYSATNQRSFRQDFGLSSQITRAAVSSMSNIAEGFERGSRKEFIQFLNIAKGSSAELRSQLYVAFDQSYFDEKTFNNLQDRAVSLSRRLAKFIQYLKTYSNDSRIRDNRKPSEL